MKRNNKELYEKIIRNVSREVRKALNESYDEYQSSKDYQELERLLRPFSYRARPFPIISVEPCSYNEYTVGKIRSRHPYIDNEIESVAREVSNWGIDSDLLVLFNPDTSCYYAGIYQRENPDGEVMPILNEHASLKDLVRDIVNNLGIVTLRCDMIMEHSYPNDMPEAVKSLINLLMYAELEDTVIVFLKQDDIYDKDMNVVTIENVMITSGFTLKVNGEHFDYNNFDENELNVLYKVTAEEAERYVTCMSKEEFFDMSNDMVS